jgi:hypothetical protein
MAKRSISFISLGLFFSLQQADQFFNHLLMAMVGMYVVLKGG